MFLKSPPTIHDTDQHIEIPVQKQLTEGCQMDNMRWLILIEKFTTLFWVSRGRRISI